MVFVMVALAVSPFEFHNNDFEFLKQTTSINVGNTSDTSFVTGEYILKFWK